LEPDGKISSRYAKRGLPVAILEYNRVQDLDLAHFASAEAQAAALADGIAYNAHDIDDGLRGGLIAFTQLDGVDVLRSMSAEVESLYPGLELVRVIHELVRRLITLFIEDAIAESQRRIAAANITSVEDVRTHGAPLVGFSEAVAQSSRSISVFLFENMYRHQRLTRVREGAALIVRELFARFLMAPDSMPADWARVAAKTANDEMRRARLVCDYIAGMTDLYAIAEHRRLFDKTPDLRLTALETQETA